MCRASLNLNSVFPIRKTDIDMIIKVIGYIEIFSYVFSNPHLSERKNNFLEGQKCGMHFLSFQDKWSISQMKTLFKQL